jgi:hypothetical protein
VVQGKVNHQGGGQVSLRSSHWRYLGLLAIVALAVGVFAGPASAKKMSAKQRAAVRAQLRKEIHKNPAAINRKSFIKRASLVNFTLPITVKLRTGSSCPTPVAGCVPMPVNANRATIDLGASLGQREVDLGGSLAGEIQFHDSYDGGALGNVDLSLRPSTTKYLTSTSIPLLWNSDVSNGGTFSDATAWDTGLASANALKGGCSDWKQGATPLPFDPRNHSGSAPPGGFPGVPVFTPPSAVPTAFVPVNPNIDDITRLTASTTPNNINNLGGNPNPFPGPVGYSPTPSGTSVEDTVLRTSPLKLNVAPEGTPVDQSTPGNNGPNGSQNIVIGKSGGQANLFGNIPGKNYGVDVTVSLATKINSIFRAVDVDSQRVFTAQKWPAALFNCRQAFTGSVQNYIPGVRLQGSLKISPAVTPAGDLRIAKVSLSSLAAPVPTRFAVAACLSLYSVLAAEQNSSDSVTYPVPPAVGLMLDAQLPADTNSYSRIGGAQNPDFSAAGTCNSTQTRLTKDANFSGLALASAANGYDSFATSTGGDKVSVAADLTVNQVEADVLIGDR